MRNENGGKKSGPILNSTSKQDYEVLSIRQTIANAGRDNKECFQEPRVSWLRTFDKSLYTLQSCLRLSIICIRRSHIKRSVHNSMNPRFSHKSNQDIKCHSKENGYRQCWECMFEYGQQDKSASQTSQYYQKRCNEASEAVLCRFCNEYGIKDEVTLEREAETRYQTEIGEVYTYM